MEVNIQVNRGESPAFAKTRSRHTDKSLAVRVLRTKRVNRVNAFTYKYFNTVANCR